MEKTKFNRSRRNFLANAGVLAIGSTLPIDILADHPFKKKEPIIDIHQHIHYMSRTDKNLIAHQEAMGVTTTILLPAEGR